MRFKQAWWLTRKEIQYGLPWFGLTMAGIVFIALAATGLLKDAVLYMAEGGDRQRTGLALDIIFLGLTPAFGALFLSGPYMSLRTIKEDPFTKRMALYRSLPIRIPVMAISRTWFMLITLALMSAVFYVTLWLALPDRFYTYLPLPEFMLFIAVWFGYALALGGLNPYIEFGTSGKMLFLLSIPGMAVLLLTVILIHIYFDRGIVEWSIQTVKSYGWPAGAVSLGIGAAGCLLWHSALARRLQRRDYR